jgi:hypothetical protein
LLGGGASAEHAPYLARMNLASPTTLRERLYRRLVVAALKRARD